MDSVNTVPGEEEVRATKSSEISSSSRAHFKDLPSLLVHDRRQLFLSVLVFHEQEEKGSHVFGLKETSPALVIKEAKESFSPSFFFFSLGESAALSSAWLLALKEAHECQFRQV